MKKLGIGRRPKQESFFKTNWKHALSHGGSLRNKRAGRGARPLSTKCSHHIVFKIHKDRLRSRSLRSNQAFTLSNLIIKKYAKHFGVKIEQLSIQNDHIHALIRTTRRSHFHHFFRVVAGQMAQRFGLEGLLSPSVYHQQAPQSSQAPRASRCVPTLPDTPMTDTPEKSTKVKSLWKYRPFSRIIRGWRSYKIVRDYIQLNEKEILGQIRYQKERLRGLSSGEWAVLWD